VELRDLVVTPLLLVIIGISAIIVRPLFKAEVNRKYFLPALWAKVIGALALGFIYQFYYSGGDTFAYHTHGSRVLWEAFTDSPFEGIRIAFSNGKYGPGLWESAEQIWLWRDPKSFIIIRLAFFLDILTFSTYSATAILFSVIAFIGGWMLFLTFYRMYPTMHQWLAISCLFIPSIVFWGSGILKDTITLAFLGMGTFAFYTIFVQKRFSIFSGMLLIISFVVIFSIKKYILISFFAAAMIWFFSNDVGKVKNPTLRFMVLPVAISLCFILGYFAINKVVEDDPRYALDKIATTAKVTANDIRYGWGARFGDGSGYTLGELDGTLSGMVQLAPQAINVSLFRPYIWEAKNALMLLTSLEGLITFLLTCYVLLLARLKIIEYIKKPAILFCLVFSLIFAFGVGVSTFNFGTLARYKIPLLPYYFAMLGMLYYYSKSDKKSDSVDVTE